MSSAPIVIVEDDAGVANLLTRIIRLTLPAAQVTTFRTAEEALPVLQRAPVTLLIVDFRLPGMSGVQLIHQVRRAQASYPILLLSGDENLPSAERVGATRVLSKPFELAKLREILGRLLSSGREHTRTEESGLAEGGTSLPLW